MSRVSDELTGAEVTGYDRRMNPVLRVLGWIFCIPLTFFLANLAIEGGISLIHWMGQKEMGGSYLDALGFLVFAGILSAVVPMFGALLITLPSIPKLMTGSLGAPIVFATLYALQAFRWVFIGFLEGQWAVVVCYGLGGILTVCGAVVASRREDESPWEG